MQTIQYISEAFSMQPSCIRVGQEYFYADGQSTRVATIKPVMVHDMVGNPTQIYRATGEDGRVCADWLASAVNVGY